MRAIIILLFVFGALGWSGYQIVKFLTPPAQDQSVTEKKVKALLDAQGLENPLKPKENLDADAIQPEPLRVSGVINFRGRYVFYLTDGTILSRSELVSYDLLRRTVDFTPRPAPVSPVVRVQLKSVVPPAAPAGAASGNLVNIETTPQAKAKATPVPDSAFSSQLPKFQ